MAATWNFIKRLYAKYDHSNLGDSAAQLAYYLLFALFPFLFFLTTLTAYLPLTRAVDEIVRQIHPLLPRSASDIVEIHLRTLVSTPRPKLLTLGVVVTIWSASRGCDSLRTALNRTYEVVEERAYWKVQLLAIGITIAGAVGLLTSTTLLLAGGSAGYWVAGHLGLGYAYLFVARWLRWPVTAAAVVFLAAAAYAYLPNTRRRLKHVMVGALAATLLWIASDFGFAAYVGHFGSYNATYGSIGGVIVLLTWLYLSGMIFLLGGAINAVLEQMRGPGTAKPDQVDDRDRPPAVLAPTSPTHGQEPEPAKSHPPA